MGLGAAIFLARLLLFPVTGLAVSGPGQDTAARPGVGEQAATSASMATVTFDFERQGLPVPRFRMVLREDGTGRYKGEVASSGTQMGEDRVVAAAPGSTVEREIMITPATTAKIFKTAQAERYFQGTCASKAKNIADTGTKTLSYAGPDGRGSCTYNYTEDKGIAMVTELFEGIATTLDEGRKIEFKRRYDRLGLDAELDVLMQASEAGRALELGTIAPLLRLLASDTEMMQRVRLRSSKLLDRATDGR